MNAKYVMVFLISALVVAGIAKLPGTNAKASDTAASAHASNTAERSGWSTPDGVKRRRLDNSCANELTSPSDQSAKDRLHRADVLLPTVPPEEREYLDKEAAAVRELATQGNESPETAARWTALTHRPLYYIWQVRKSLETATQAVEKIDDTTHHLSGQVNLPRTSKCDPESRARDLKKNKRVVRCTALPSGTRPPPEAWRPGANQLASFRR